MRKGSTSDDYRDIKVDELLEDLKFTNYGGLRNKSFLSKCIDKSTSYFTGIKKRGRMEVSDLTRICKLCKLNPQDYIVDSQIVEVKTEPVPDMVIDEASDNRIIIAHIGDIMKKLNEMERKLDELKEIWA